MMRTSIVVDFDDALNVHPAHGAGVAPAGQHVPAGVAGDQVVAGPQQAVAGLVHADAAVVLLRLGQRWGNEL